MWLIGKAPLTDEVIEISLEDLIKIGVNSASQHVGEPVKLFIVASDEETKEFSNETNNDDYSGSDSVG